MSDKITNKEKSSKSSQVIIKSIYYNFLLLHSTNNSLGHRNGKIKKSGGLKNIELEHTVYYTLKRAWMIG